MEENSKNISDLKDIKSISKGALIYFVGTVLSKIISYAYLIVRAKFLGAFWLGVYALGTTAVVLLSILSRMGLPLALTRFVSIYKRSKDNKGLKGLLEFSFEVAFVASIIVSVILFFSARILSISVFHNSELIKPLRFFCLAIPPVTVFSLFIGTFRGLKDVKSIVIMHFLQQVLAFICFLVFLNFVKPKVFAAISAFIISYILCILMSYLKLVQKLPFLIKRNIRPLFNKRELLAYSTPLMLLVVIRLIFQKVDIVMIGYYLSPKEVGFYSPAFQFSLIVVFPLLAFGQLFGPLVATYYKDNRQRELGYLYKTITRLVFTMSFPLFLLILLFSKDIMLILGKQYVQAWQVLTILGFTQLIATIVGNTGVILTMMMHQNKIVVISGIAVFLNIVCNALLIPHFGIMGAAISTLFSITLLNSLSLFFVYKAFNIQPFTIKFYKPFLSGILAFLIVLFLCGVVNFGDYKIKVLVLGFLFMILYLIFTWVFKYEEEEVMIFKAIKGKIFQNHQ